MFLVEMGVHTYRAINHDPELKDTGLRLNLDLLEEERNKGKLHAN